MASEQMSAPTSPADPWRELFGAVNSIGETIDVSLQAFLPETAGTKIISVTTKKRLIAKALHGMEQGKGGIQVIFQHLHALQEASKQWRRSMMYASSSHEDLMEQLDTTTQELKRSNERLQAVEKQRQSAVHDMEIAQHRLSQLETDKKLLESTLSTRDEDLASAQFRLHELKIELEQALDQNQALNKEAELAQTKMQSATGESKEAKAEAAKAISIAERHKEMVAKLTADNLVFLMQLKKTEAELVIANKDIVNLRLAAEKQRGPWFDQVRAGVEERVKQAMVRAEELQEELKATEARHAAQIEEMAATRQQLEDSLSVSVDNIMQLEQALAAAEEAEQSATEDAAAARADALEQSQRAAALAAEKTVLQEDVRSMRLECTERWVKEQAAIGQLDGLRTQLATSQEALAACRLSLSRLQADLDAQRAVNRQLMSRKEEVEWQLMAAMAKLDDAAPGQGHAPPPLSLLVSGQLQVGQNSYTPARTLAVRDMDPASNRGAGDSEVWSIQTAARPADVSHTEQDGGSRPSGLAGGSSTEQAHTMRYTDSRQNNLTGTASFEQAQAEQHNTVGSSHTGATLGATGYEQAQSQRYSDRGTISATGIREQQQTEVHRCADTHTSTVAGSTGPEQAHIQRHSDSRMSSAAGSTGHEQAHLQRQPDSRTSSVAGSTGHEQARGYEQVQIQQYGNSSIGSAAGNPSHRQAEIHHSSAEADVAVSAAHFAAHGATASEDEQEASFAFAAGRQLNSEHGESIPYGQGESEEVEVGSPEAEENARMPFGMEMQDDEGHLAQTSASGPTSTAIADVNVSASIMASEVGATQVDGNAAYESSGRFDGRAVPLDAEDEDFLAAPGRRVTALSVCVTQAPNVRPSLRFVAKRYDTLTS